MLQVYDRVLTSGSVDTLILLTVLAVGLFVVYAAADTGRKRVFALMGATVGQQLEAEIFARGMTPLGSGRKFESSVGDLGRVQQVLSGGSIQVFFDLPFSPFFCILVFLVHPMLGFMTIGGAVILGLIAWRTERVTSDPLGQAGQQEQAASAFLGGVSRQNDVIMAMGMGEAMLARWRALRAMAAKASMAANSVANTYGGSSRSFRQMLQTLILGAAAWLVLRQEISSGAIIASSILSGRALAPIDLAIASWKPLLRGRESWKKLETYVADVEMPEAVTPLADPKPRLVIDTLAVEVPGSDQPLLAPLSATVEPGQVALIIGTSGQGKSSLLRTLAAIWPAGGGSVSLGGRDLHSWASGDRGRHIGYLAQQLDLLPGTIRQNVERFTNQHEELAFAAAKAVGANEAILGLPNGYDTPFSNDGSISPGQRQLIGLARAEYGQPALVLLDEPTASLDQAAVQNVIAYLQGLRDQGRVAIVSTHDMRLFAVGDLMINIAQRKPALVSKEAFSAAMAKRKSAGNIVTVVP